MKVLWWHPFICSGPRCIMHCHTSHGYFIASNVHAFSILALGFRFALLVLYNSCFDVMQILFSITFNFKFQILAGFYVLAMLQEAADRVIYLLTFHIVSGHTLKHLSAAMVPIILTVMLAKRSVYSEKLLHVRNTQLHPIQMWIIMKDFGLKFQWKECWHCQHKMSQHYRPGYGYAMNDSPFASKLFAVISIWIPNH